MGFMTLGDFKAEVVSVLGQRAIAANRDRAWVNMAYFDVAGAVDFPELDTSDTVDLDAGEYQIDIPPRVMQIITVYDEAVNTGLRKVDKVEIFRQDLSETGDPETWARHGDKILIYPAIGTSRSLELIGRSEPVALVADGDLTILPRTWDAAIMMLANAYALMALNEDARSIGWYNKALNYMQSRLIEGSMQMPPAPGGK